MFSSVVESIGNGAIALAESGRLPDRLVRSGMNRVVAARLRKEANGDPAARETFWREAWNGPVAVNTSDANVQHYEVPAAFFELVLGGHLKYSSAFWPEGVFDLETAEEAMLRLTAERAGLADGQRILDLGCGWGSMTLWAARAFPDSKVTALSNSSSQRHFIESRAQQMGVTNIRVLTADINDFVPDGSFDRIVSVEMLEHVRNHRELFRRAAGWLDSEGAFFVHVFAHHSRAYPFETGGPASWMAETFFTGGVMPSRRLLPDAADPYLRLDGDWWIDGTHYSRTLEAWLERFDARTGEISDVFRPVYGGETDLWMQRWRMFFMACSQMFRYAEGTEWGIAHHRFELA